MKEHKSDNELLRLAKRSFATYKKYDTKRGFAFTLTVEDVCRAKSSLCHYCGRAATGFDRIDNDKGHTLENCIPACIRCNWVRGNYLSHEVMEHVGQLLRIVDP